MYEIEKGLEIPKGYMHGNKYPWGKMEVGDSILVDGESASYPHCKAYSAARVYGLRNGVKFTARKQGNGKVRIWRVE